MGMKLEHHLVLLHCLPPTNFKMAYAEEPSFAVPREMNHCAVKWANLDCLLVFGQLNLEFLFYEAT